MTEKIVVLSDFLTEAEMKRCIELYKQFRGSGQFATAVANEIMQPNLERINQAIGQENDPRYLAYMVEYALMRAAEPK